MSKAIVVGSGRYGQLELGIFSEHFQYDELLVMTPSSAIEPHTVCIDQETGKKRWIADPGEVEPERRLGQWQ